MSKSKVNDPCHCGSGRKYKKCCMREDILPEDERGLAEPGPISQERKDATDRMMAEEGWTAEKAAKIAKIARKRRAYGRRPLGLRGVCMLAMLNMITRGIA